MKNTQARRDDIRLHAPADSRLSCRPVPLRGHGGPLAAAAGDGGLPSVYSEVRRTGPGASQQIEHRHRELEFNLILNGRGTYFLPEGQHDLAPGALVWLLPGQPHRLIRSPDLDMWVATIPPDQLDPEILRDVALHPFRQLDAESAVALDRLLTHISQDAGEPRLQRTGLEYAFSNAWHITMTSPGPARRPMHPAVVQALSIVRSSPEMPSAAVLAGKCGITRNYLGQLLLEHTGLGFVAWRNRIRLERFHIAYSNAGSLLNAALDAGFGSYAQFHRVFCELVGTTPGDWARNGTSATALPSVANVMTGDGAPGMRMSWYALCDISLPAASRWFDSGFGLRFRDADASEQTLPAIEWIQGALSDLNRHLPLYLEEVRTGYPAISDQFTRAMDRNNLFDVFRSLSEMYEIDSADLANLLSIYICFAGIAADLTAMPSRKDFEGIVRRIRRTLHESRALHAATGLELEIAGGALIIQSILLRNAATGSRASGSGKIAQRVAMAAIDSVRATLGIDLTATGLF